MKIIDMEAHFLTNDYLEHLLNRKQMPKASTEGNVFKVWYTNDFFIERAIEANAPLLDLGEGRLRAMDAAGISIQVLSLTNPHIQYFEPSEGTAWARRVNDELATAVRKYPDRLVGLASVAPQSPEEAADELERAVTELGLKGVCIQSHASC